MIMLRMICFFCTLIPFFRRFGTYRYFLSDARFILYNFHVSICDMIQIRFLIFNFLEKAQNVDLFARISDSCRRVSAGQPPVAYRGYFCLEIPPNISTYRPQNLYFSLFSTAGRWSARSSPGGIGLH